MTHAAAATGTLQLPAAGHQGRRRGSAAAGMKDYLAAHPAGLVAVTSHLRDRLARLVFGSGGADIIGTSTTPALVVPVETVEG